MDVTLLFPPQWTPTQPYLGTACLTGYLKEHGFTCHQIDLNAAFYNCILQKPIIEKSMQIITEKITRLEKKDTLLPEEKETYKKIAMLSALGEYILDTMEESVRFMKSTKSLSDCKAFIFHQGIVNHALQIFSTANDFSLSLSEMKLQSDMKNSENMVQKAREDTFLAHIYREHFINRIISRNTAVCGISITGISQVFPSLVLAHCIKEKYPSVRIILGGSILTRVKDSISAIMNILNLCDGIMIKEGEIGLLRFCTGYEDEDVPGLIFRKGSHICYNNMEYIQDVNELPPPDFSGIQPNLYFSPELVLPVYGSRACYWGKCAFCDHGSGYHKTYRERSAESVVRDLEYLASTWNTNYFTFSDEALRPTHFYQISQEILKKGLEIRWITNMRGEGTLTRNMCETAFKAGCRVLMVGFESGSQRVLNRMRKGISIESLKRDLRISSAAGIWNHGFFFFGFPGETPSDAVKTMQFVAHNKDVLHSVGGATFTLGNYSHIFREMAHFDVKSIQLNPGEDLGIWVDYTVKGGLTGSQARNVSENFEKRLKNIYPYYLFTRKVGREYLLLFMDTLGRKGIIESYTEEGKGKGKERKRRRKNEIAEEVIKNPRLSDHVRIARFSHDFLGGKESEIGTFIVANILNEKLMEVSETAYFILNLCDGVHTLQAIAERISETYDQSYDRVLKDTKAFILEMWREEIITISAMQSEICKALT